MIPTFLDLYQCPGKKMKNIINSTISLLALCLLALCLLASCGGGGGSESESSTALIPDNKDAIIAAAEPIENKHLSGGEANIKKVQSYAF